MSATAGTDWCWTELDRFEAAARCDPSADLTHFLPPADHPAYREALTELARLDMELAHRRGETRPPERYFAWFPELAADSVAAAGVEHGYRQLHGHPDGNPPPTCAVSRVSVAPADHLANPEPTRAVAARPSTPDLSAPGHPHTPPPASAMPVIGDKLAGFLLTAELGKGAFGRVFLAEQGDLAGRPVAVKVGAGLVGESHTLARLQHTNIVPIYSAHRHGRLTAVCMPYLGRTTLAHLLFRIRSDVMPESVRHLIETFNQKAESTQPNRPSDPPPPTEVVAGLTPVTTKPQLTTDSDLPVALHGGVWDRLTNGTLADAAVWIAAQLAAGLAHAHERGILHRDIKPANVLLTDDGVPMLLDFNLADDANATGELQSAAAGGTLPYMAPEQMAVYAGKQVLPTDARADLFSLGVVLYELLAGVRPFPDRSGPARQALAAMEQDRTQPPPPVRRRNPFVRPSLEALVLKLLAPDPAARYQTAADLTEDLNRYLGRQPLKHGPNPSWRERAKNWAVRHPRLVSSGTVGGVIGAFAVLALGAGVMAREQTRTLEARVAFDDHGRELRGLQTLLDDRGLSRPRLDDALGQCERNLARYGLRADADTPTAEWDRHVLVRYLPDADRDRLRERTAELYFLLGRAAFQRAKMTADGTERTAAVADAERWNRQAAAFGGAVLARAVAEQRADLLRMAGRPADADKLVADSAAVAPGSPRDRFLLGFWWYQRGHLRKALPELAAATADDPTNFSAWFVLGTTHLNLEQPDLAAMCFTACVALRADFAPAWLNRGLAFMKLGKPQLAVADFDAAIKLDPERAELHYLRAGALGQVGKHREAVGGYTDALACADCPPRVYLYRAAEREALKDEVGAKADRAEGERREPTDALGWVARAEGVAESDPTAALKYVDQALDLSPLEVSALQLKAHLLSEKLDRPADAIKVLDRALEHYPEHVQCLAGRAVMKARGKDRTGAIADAQAALLLNARGANLAQIGCVYAQTSRVEPADRFKAVELLSAAIRDGFDPAFLADDPDLDPLRATDEFRALLKQYAPKK
jgi:serine/threonine protein kinase/regulator of sirC expression with transglutaminase-like and TPR domain